MNYGLVQLGEDDYFWATDRLRSIAETHSKVCLHAHTHTHIHTYTNTPTHTHIHT